MKTRLAMVAARMPCEGPWMRARGNEIGVRVRGLVEGERIVSRVSIAGVNQPLVVLDRDGTFPLPEAWEKISFVKESTNEKGHGTTHVELLVE